MFDTRKSAVHALLSVTILASAACSDAPLIDESPRDVSSAIEDFDAELLEQLIDDGADISSVQSVSGYTPLHQAADV